MATRSADTTFGPTTRKNRLEGKVGPIESPLMIVDRKTISIKKACELVGVSRRTIYNWISNGKVEYVRTAGGSVRIFVDTLWRDPGTTPSRFDLAHTD